MVTSADMPELPVLHVKGLRDCNLTIPVGTTVVKLLVESCVDCIITLDGKITTNTLELLYVKGLGIGVQGAISMLIHNNTTHYETPVVTS